MHLLRGTVALVFMAHAVVRLLNGSVPRFAHFLESNGFTPGAGWVLAISACEIACGLMLLSGMAVKWACGALAGIVITGIVLIHARNGWFVGEHGNGGMEFSVLLCAALLAIACADQANWWPSWYVVAWRRGKVADGNGPSA